MRLSALAASLLCALSVGLLGAGCSAPPEEQEEDVAEEESNLDYRSTVGKEFAISAETSITLNVDDATLTGDALAAKVTELARLKIDAITLALEEELKRVWPEEQRQKAKNVVAMIRMSTPKASEMRVEGSIRRFTYRAEIAGPNDLLDLLPLQRNGAKRSSKLVVGDETLALAWSPSAATADSYPRYAEMFQGGLDIAIHVGGDHYEPRNDLNEARAIYTELETLGLRSPVSSFEQLKLGSAPFQGSIDLGDRLVPVRATLVHADMAPDDRLQDLVDAFKKAAKTADVVIYRGHAGTRLDYSGVVVHYEPRVGIPATEFKDLDLPSKYQLFVFDGCETYTGYADKLFEHPAKNEKNADVITSVSYGSALAKGESVRAILQGLIQPSGTWWIPGSSRWLPRSWDALLGKVNEVQRGPWTSIYGVHGLADNPKISMFADPSQIGKSCWLSSQCPGADSLCVRTSSGSVCGGACADDAGCPSGTTCRPVRSVTLGSLKQCLPP